MKKMLDNIYIKEIYEDIIKIYGDDIANEVFIVLKRLDKNKIEDAIDKNYLKYLSFRIAKCLFYNDKKDNYTNKKDKNIDVKLLSLVDSCYIDDNKKDIIDKVIKILNSVRWYERYIFQLYYFDNMTLKDISMKTGVNIKTVFYNIKKVRNHIIKTIKNKN